MTNQEGVIREVGGHHRNRRNGKLEKQWNTIGPSGLEATSRQDHQQRKPAP